MITVTAALRGVCKPYKPTGAHFKPYGAGRRPLIDTSATKRRKRIPRHADPFSHSADNSVDNQAHSSGCCASHISFVARIWTKLMSLLSMLLNWLCPYFFSRLLTNVADLESAENLIAKQIKTWPECHHSDIKRLNDKLLAEVLTLLDVGSIRSCDLVCRRWNNVVQDYCQRMPKVQCDQIKVHLDEGEVIISAVDVRSQPRRLALPSADRLGGYLRHMRTSSLFIRGMIEGETWPFLNALSLQHLAPTEVYFLWCNFATDGRNCLIDFLNSHRQSLVDLGFEGCYPNYVISDELLIATTDHLQSLRVWSDGKRGRYQVSDATLHFIAHQRLPFDTIDLSNTVVSAKGLVELIKCWMERPKRDCTICIANSLNIRKTDILRQCTGANIPLQSRGIYSGGYRLTFCCT